MQCTSAVHHCLVQGSSPSDPDDLLLSLCKLVAQIIMYCPRQEGNKWKLQKLHELLHFPLMLFFFCHAENFDAGTGERHLKDVFKDVARNSQQQGQDTFLHQVGARMHEKLILTKAKQFSVGMAEYNSAKQHNVASPTNASNDITHTLQHNKMHVISYHETNHNNGWNMGRCTAHLTGMNPSSQIHPVILSWLADNWETKIGSDRESIKCYMEMNVKEGPTYHAHPNYHNKVRGKIGLMYHSGKMSKVCSKWFHPEYCCSISITLLMTMETRVMKSELLITKWVAITQGGIIWKKHTCAATGSYP